MFFKHAKIFLVTPIGLKVSADCKANKFYISIWLIRSLEFFIAEVFLYLLFLVVQIYLVRPLYFANENTLILSFMYVLLLCMVLTQALAVQLHRKREVFPSYFVAWLGLLLQVQSKFALKENIEKLNNSIVTFGLYFKEKFMRKLDPNNCLQNRIFDGILLALVGILPLIATFISMHSIVYHHWPCYITSVLKPENWFSRILFTWWWFWMLQGVWALVGLALLLLLLNMWYMWFLLQEFNCTGTLLKTQLASYSFRNFRNLKLYYSQLQILHIVFIDLMGVMIIPLTGCVTKLVILSNYTLIRYWEKINFIGAGMMLILSITSTTVVIISYTAFAILREKCLLAMVSMKQFDWGSKRENKEMKRFIRSRKAISYGYGSMCLLTRKSVLKFLKCITRGTFRILLAL